MFDGLDALIFDVDGTLADTERDGHRPAFNGAFAEVGLDWDWSVECYGELLAVTGGKERIAHYIECWQPGFLPPPGYPDIGALIVDLHRRKTALYLARLAAGGIPPRPGVLRLLREARAGGVRLAIATTTTPENVTALLAAMPQPGLVDWFEVIAAGDVVPRKKPAPDIFTLALAQLDLPACACVAIEDSDNGAAAALAAGLRALVITESAYTTGQQFGGAPLVVDQLGEPDAPARVRHGDLGARPWVDLAHLAALRARVCGPVR